jgi:heme oxygenase
LGGTVIFRDLALPSVYRSQALLCDLTALCGSGWADALPLLPQGRAYGARIATVAQGDGTCLIAHAYVRTLGDLNGGQVLKRLLARTLGLGDAALSFYDFPDIADLVAFRAAYRSALDRAGAQIADMAPVVEEAAAAFALNISVSEAVRREAAMQEAAEPV